MSKGQPVKLFGVFIAEADRSDGLVDKLHLVNQPALFFPGVNRNKFETEIIKIVYRMTAYEFGYVDQLSYNVLLCTYSAGISHTNVG